MYYNKVKYINNPLALQSIETQSLPADCWLHILLSADYPASLGVTCGQYIEFSSRCR